MMKVLEEKQIKTEKLYGFTRYLLIEINNGYGLLDCESTTCFGYFYKIYKIDFEIGDKIEELVGNDEYLRKTGEDFREFTNLLAKDKTYENMIEEFDFWVI